MAVGLSYSDQLRQSIAQAGLEREAQGVASEEESDRTRQAWTTLGLLGAGALTGGLAPAALGATSALAGVGAGAGLGSLTGQLLSGAEQAASGDTAPGLTRAATAGTGLANLTNQVADDRYQLAYDNALDRFMRDKEFAKFDALTSTRGERAFRQGGMSGFNAYMNPPKAGG